MIEPYSNATQTKWNNGGFKVQVQTPESSRPFGYCDGTAEDLAQLKAIAENENAEMKIDIKKLKTGREIWTLVTSGGRGSAEE